MKLSFGGDRKDRLIEDVIPPESPYFDVRSPRVQHQAIGALDDAYRWLPHAKSGYSASKSKPRWYTRIPPLSSLAAAGALEPGLSHDLPDYWQRFKGSLKAALAASLIWLKEARLKYLPRHIYSLDSGRHIYWGDHKVANRIKLAAALAIIGLLILAGFLISSLSGGNNSAKHKYAANHGSAQPPTTVIKTVNQTSPPNQNQAAATNSASSMPAGNIPSASASSSSGGPLPISSTPSSTSLIGGMGGGSPASSSGSTTPASSGSSGTSTSPSGGTIINTCTPPLILDPSTKACVSADPPLPAY